jgi:hypothetical protein
MSSKSTQIKSSNNYRDPRINHQDIASLIAEVGEKHLLHEITQCVFGGVNPRFTWTNKSTIMIEVADLIKYPYNISLDQKWTSFSKRRYETQAARKCIDYLSTDSEFADSVSIFLLKRISRSNIPFRFTREDIIQRANVASVVILIDAENIPDFRKIFYIGSHGEIRFTSPRLPNLIQAPSLSSSTSSTSSTSTIGSSSLGSFVIENEPFQLINNNYLDEEILILSYAHHTGPQSVVANRIMYSDRKDATDGKSVCLIIIIINILLLLLFMI